MGQDKFELFVKDKIGDYESPVDGDALWASIQTAQGSNATTAASGLSATSKLIIGSVLLVSMIATGIWLLNNQKQQSDSSLSMELTEDQDANELQEITTEAFVTEDQTALNEQISVDQAKTEVAINNNNNVDGNFNTSNTIPVVKPEQSRIDSKTAQATYPGQVDSNQVQTTNTSGSETAENKAAVQQMASKQIVKEEPPINEASSVNTSDVENTTFNSTNTVTASNLGISLKSNAATQRSLVEASNIDPIGLNLYQQSNALFSNNPQPVTCPDFGNNRGSGSFGFELQAIPYYSMKQFNALDELGQEWQETRQATESYLESFQINALLRYQHSSGIYAHAGIGYGQIDEKVELNAEDFSDITVDTITIIIFHPNGDIDTITGPVMGTSETELNAKVYNYHRMIELPFAVGYEFPVNNRMGIYADLGGSLNLAVFRNGYTVVDQTELVPFDSTSRPVYKTSTGFKIKSSVGLRYYTNSGITLSAGPEIRYHTSNWLRDELTLEQRYLEIGLRFAAGFTF